MLGARSLGLPTAILEANVEFGLANRWLSPWVDRVFRGLDSPDGRGIGMPLRPMDVGVASVAPSPAGTVRLLVASGSRGESFFSREVPRLCAALQVAELTPEVWQQTTAPEPLADTYARMGITARVEPFIVDMAAAYAWADVVLARAGASTIAELALTGRPALLVPLADASANHQHANARLWQSAGAGLCLTEAEWTIDRAATWLTTAGRDDQARETMATAARTLARPTAAEDIVAACLSMIESRRR